MKLLLYERELVEEVNRRISGADSFWIAQALISADGMAEVAASIRASLDRGGHGQVLVGVDMPTDPAAIKELLRIQQSYQSQLEVRFFKSGKQRMFHAKFAVFDDGRGVSTAILGSSNLTRGGMFQNYEANVLISDRALVGKLLDYFNEHFSGGHSRRISEDWLAEYEKLWLQRQKAVLRLRAVRSKVRRIGARPEGEGEVPKRIKGHTFAFTGGIEDWPRERKLYPRVRKLGGKLVWTARAMEKADCLIHGDILGGKKSTMKLRRAKKLGVPIISGEEFLAIMGRGK